MPNPLQRIGPDRQEHSARAEVFLGARQGNLHRRSGGYRTPYEIDEPRRPVKEGYKPDPPMQPYHYGLDSPPGAPFPNKPNTHAFFRPASLGAPRVGFPDAERCGGNYQQSGAAWGTLPNTQRPTLQPRTDGHNGPPTLTMGQHRPTLTAGSYLHWKRPASPVLRDHMPH